MSFGDPDRQEYEDLLSRLLQAVAERDRTTFDELVGHAIILARTQGSDLAARLGDEFEWSDDGALVWKDGPE